MRIIFLIFTVFLLVSVCTSSRSRKGKKGKKRNKLAQTNRSEKLPKQSAPDAKESSEPADSHFVMMEKFRPPYSRIRPSDPKDLLGCKKAYFSSLESLKIDEIAGFAENSAYIRDFIMPRLRTAVKVQNPKSEISKQMIVLKEFIDNTHLCHEFWLLQMELFDEKKVDLAHHLFDEYMAASKNCRNFMKNDHKMDHIQLDALEYVKKVDRRKQSLYTGRKFLQKFKKEFPTQHTLERCLDFCSQQYVTMISALKRYLQIVSQDDDPKCWPANITYSALMTSHIYATNFWMRKLVEIKSEMELEKKYLLIGRFVSFLDCTQRAGAPKLFELIGDNQFNERGIYLQSYFTKKVTELRSGGSPVLTADFNTLTLVHDLAVLRILWSLWHQLRYPYDPKNFFKIILDYKGFEATYRFPAMSRHIVLASQNHISLAQLGILSQQAYQEYFSECLANWPIEIASKISATLKDSRPLTDEEWAILVTPSKRLEREAFKSALINLSGSAVEHDCDVDLGSTTDLEADEYVVSDGDRISTYDHDSDNRNDLSANLPSAGEDDVEVDGKDSSAGDSTKLDSDNQQDTTNAKSETVEEETARLMKEHQANLDYYNNLRKAEGWELVRKRKEARLLSSNATYMATTEPIILLNRLGDFLALFPEAARVHEMNRKNRTVVKVLNRHNKKQLFRWALDRSVVIDFKTYKFLAAVFVPTLSSRKTLNFDNFEDCVRALGGTVSGTIYSFPRRLEVDGQTYITPPGEVHSEHKSSDVNHKSMSIFLGYSGFHISLFEPIDLK